MLVVRSMIFLGAFLTEKIFEISRSKKKGSEIGVNIYRVPCALLVGLAIGTELFGQRLRAEDVPDQLIT